MNKRVKLALAMCLIVILICVLIFGVSSYLHKNNTPTVSTLPMETYGELTQPEELIVENNIPTTDTSYSDVDYLFREYISDNSISTGSISLDGYEINPGSGDIKIYGTRDGSSWEFVKINEGKE